MILNVSRKQNKFSCTLFTELHVCSQETRTLPQILDCFEYPKNPYLNQATQKHTCQIFLPKRKPHNLKISNPENSIDHSLHLKSRVPPWGKDPFSSTCQQYKTWHLPLALASQGCSNFHHSSQEKCASTKQKKCHKYNTLLLHMFLLLAWDLKILLISLTSIQGPGYLTPRS